MDIRDVGPGDLEGFDAVVHLAAISNDPLGNLNPACTYDINHRASAHRPAQLNPVMPYGESKVLAERTSPPWPGTT